MPAPKSVPVEYATFHAFLVRKYFVKGINYLDERYGESWSDVELCYQIRRASRKTLVLPQATALYTRQLPLLGRLRNDFGGRPDPWRGGLFRQTLWLHYRLGFRLKEILKALFTFRLGLFAALVSGSKIDGSQSAIL